MRIITAAIVGGLIVFGVSAVFHTLTPLGTMGLSFLPNEDPVMQAFKTNIPRSGLYFFPGGTMGKMTEQEQQAWAAKLRSGPSGLIVYTAEGLEAMEPRQLVSELIANILAAAIASILLTFMAAPYITKAISCALLAVFAFLSLSASHWIWYHYPTTFVAAELVMEFIAWLLAGLVIAKIVTPKSA